MSSEKKPITISINFFIKVFYFFPLAVFGIMHFASPDYFLFLVPKFVPGGIFWVYFSGVALTGASMAIMMNIIPKLAAVGLILFVLTFIITVDIPGIFFGIDKYHFFISLLKDISLFAGTCFFFYEKVAPNLVIKKAS